MNNIAFFKELKKQVEEVIDFYFLYDGGAYIEEVLLEYKIICLSDNSDIDFNDFDINYLTTLQRNEIEFSVENLYKCYQSELKFETTEFQKYIALNSENNICCDVEDLILNSKVNRINKIYVQNKTKLPQSLKKLWK